MRNFLNLTREPRDIIARLFLFPQIIQGLCFTANTALLGRVLVYVRYFAGYIDKDQFHNTIPSLPRSIFNFSLFSNKIGTYPISSAFFKLFGASSINTTSLGETPSF